MTYAVGDALPPFVVERVTPTTMRAWAGFLNDSNPLHLDVEAVKAKGLGDRLINQGPINMAYLMNMLLVAFPGGVIESIETRFLDNVYAEDRAVAGGHVRAIDGDRIACEMTLDVTGRGIVNAGTATIRI